MKLEIFTLCDSVVFKDCTIDILGAFDRYFVPIFPHAISFTIFIQLRFDRKESGAHAIVLRVLDPNGKEIARADGIYEKKFFTGLDSSPMHVVLEMSNLGIKQPGELTVDLEVDHLFRQAHTLTILAAS